MHQRLSLAVAVVALAALAFGCAITDYGGIPGHKTQAEAKLWGKEIAFSGFAPDLDGTYSYTARYGSTGNVTISSYRNPVVASFSRDGLVDRDGDDIQGNSGDNGGKFNNQFVAVDAEPGAPCGFFANITQDKSDTGALLALCLPGFNEEVDKDLDLMDAFGSLDELFRGIWGGSVPSRFTLELTSVTLNGVRVDLTNALSIDLAHNGVRPINAAMDVSTPGGQELLQAILANTAHGEAVTVGFGFHGGLAFGMPSGVTVAFNHDVLAAALQ